MCAPSVRRVGASVPPCVWIRDEDRRLHAFQGAVWRLPPRTEAVSQLYALQRVSRTIAKVLTNDENDENDESEKGKPEYPS